MIRVHLKMKKYWENFREAALKAREKQGIYKSRALSTYTVKCPKNNMIS